MIVSDDALMLHWKQTCWGAHLWHQADQNKIQLQPMLSRGWELSQSGLKVVWDSEKNVRDIHERVCALTRGCKCVTGRITK